MTVLKGRSELGVAALLLIVAALVAHDASGLQAGAVQVGPVGPELVPYLVSALLAVCGVMLAVDVLRGGAGEAEGGEDIDLTHAVDWRTVLLLAGAFVANILLMERLGWVLSGTLLYWGCASALGSRNWVRDGLIAVLISIGTFYGFYSGLGIALPAGILKGLL